MVDSTHLKMRVWERGSGETWACGTGTCATVAALTELGVCPAGEDVHVQLRGGELIIRVLPGKKLLMTGSAVTVYEGVTEVQLKCILALSVAILPLSLARISLRPDAERPERAATYKERIEGKYHENEPLQ